MRPDVWRRTLARTGAVGANTRQSIVALAGLGRELARCGPNLFTIVAWRAREAPDQVAVIDARSQLTYRELVNESETLARWLANQSLGSPRVAVLCQQSRNIVLMLLAAQRCGVDAVLLNTFQSADEVAALTHAHRLVVVTDDPAAAPPGAVALPLSSAAAGGGTACMKRARRAANVTILTSGTTGTPSMVDSRPSLSAVDTLTDFVGSLGARRHDRVRVMLPLFHGHGLASVVLGLALGGTVTLRSPADQRLDDFADDWAAIDAGEVDILVVVPTVLQRLLAAAPQPDRTPTDSTRKLRAIVTGSAPLSSDTVAATVKQFGPILHNVYGTSETGVLTHASPADLAVDPTTVGRPLLGVECEIRDPPDTSTIGTVWVRGGMAGRAWTTTHDLGSFDGEGRLRLHGRDDSVLVIGGENVLPEALETRIAALDGVAECAVRGMPDPEYGARVELLVRLTDDTTVGDLASTLEANLPRTLRPASIIEVDELPRTPLGKLKRHALPPR